MKLYYKYKNENIIFTIDKTKFLLSELEMI